MRVVRHCLNLFSQIDKLYPWPLKNSTPENQTIRQQIRESETPSPVDKEIRDYEKRKQKKTKQKTRENETSRPIRNAFEISRSGESVSAFCNEFWIQKYRSKCKRFWIISENRVRAFTLGFNVKTAVILLKSISEFVFNRARSTLYRARWRTFIELPTMCFTWRSGNATA